MKLIPCDLNELKKIEQRKRNLYPILTEFINSQMDCARLEEWTFKNANSCQSCLWSAIHKYYDGRIKVVLVENDVYLIKVCAE